MRPSTSFLAFALLAVFLPAYSAPFELNLDDPLKVEKFFGPKRAVKNIRAPHSGLKFIGRPSTLQFRAPQGRGDGRAPAFQAVPALGSESAPVPAPAPIPEFQSAPAPADEADGGGDEGASEDD